MKATIDEAGRVVLPEAIREAAGLSPGMDVEVRLSDGKIEIELEISDETLPVKLVRRPGGLLVAVPLVDVEPLTTEDVQRTLDALREERGLIRDG
jgi:AbrB family looped-hinge helix DNA binding protein